mmetsp:Transcript_19021/g.36636  ORF Transcript_19021/g.36636 Transcript_19021/m.36636 type:complete len:91 (-) Transcript_19021:241-513(-)
MGMHCVGLCLSIKVIQIISTALGRRGVLLSDSSLLALLLHAIIQGEVLCPQQLSLGRLLTPYRLNRMGLAMQPSMDLVQDMAYSAHEASH